MFKAEESQDVQYEEAKARADKRAVFKYQKRTILPGRLVPAVCCPRTQLECKDGRFLVPDNYNILHFTVPNYFQKVLSKTLSYSGR